MLSFYKLVDSFVGTIIFVHEKVVYRHGEALQISSCFLLPHGVDLLILVALRTIALVHVEIVRSFTRLHVIVVG